MSLSAADHARLLKAAQAARVRAYAPYSGFRVGAALLSTDGSVFAGCNLENASYGLTVCAERHALSAAVLADAPALTALLVLTDAATPTTPCGACRQVLSELAPASLDVCCVTEGGGRLDTTLGELLPMGFGEASLK